MAILRDMHAKGKKAQEISSSMLYWSFLVHKVSSSSSFLGKKAKRIRVKRSAYHSSLPSRLFITFLYQRKLKKRQQINPNFGVAKRRKLNRKPKKPTVFRKI